MLYISGEDIINTYSCYLCGEQIECDDNGERDTETCGGYSVDYFKCSKCNAQYEYIQNGEPDNNLCLINGD